MKIKKISKNKFILILEKGEDILVSIKDFAEKQKINSGSFTGIGALDQVEIGYFDLKTNKYNFADIQTPVEILSLIGNITKKDNSPFVHAHITLGNDNFKAEGGHLRKSRVSLTCEIILEAYTKEIKRKLDKKTGVNQID